jgi:hypothetical protein
MAREKLNFESYGDTILLEHEELITSNVSEVYKLSLPEEKKRKIVEKYVGSLHIYPEYVSIWIESHMEEDFYLIKYNEKFIEEELEKGRNYMYPAYLIGDSCLEDMIRSMSFVSNWSDCLEDLLEREGICDKRGSLISRSNNLKNQIWLLPSEMLFLEPEDYYKNIE